jgi:CheY-like chemotaxis protein
MLLKKIVIADDDDGVAHMLTASLGDAGYLCLRAHDGEEALTLVRAQLPDALVLDVMMPKLGGIEVVKRLKGDVVASQVPVLMLTSLGEVDDRVIGLDAGADDYLAKPFDFRELRARVGALIRGARRERERDPTTNLPGAQALEEHLGGLLAGGGEFWVAYLELGGYEAVCERDGFVAAQARVRRLSEVVLERSRGAGFAAAVGMGDFVVVGLLDTGRVAAEIARDYAADAGDPPGATFVRATVVSAGGCRSMDELAVRIAQARALLHGSARA